MTKLLIHADNTPLTIEFPAIATMTQADFIEFCKANRDLRIERTAQGEVIVMPPTFSDTGNRNMKIGYYLTRWAEEQGTGETFDSSTGFTLPNGATRSADAAWIEQERWNALTPEERASFAPICPDFVIELRSASDNLGKLQAKMQEYIDNGVGLGWLIDRQARQVYIYRPDRGVSAEGNISVETLDRPEVVSGDPELPGFRLEMARIW
jgi:Uma2 family endonuclease